MNTRSSLRVPGGPSPSAALARCLVAALAAVFCRGPVQRRGAAQERDAPTSDTFLLMPEQAALRVYAWRDDAIVIGSTGTLRLSVTAQGRAVLASEPMMSFQQGELWDTNVALGGDFFIGLQGGDVVLRSSHTLAERWRRPLDDTARNGPFEHHAIRPVAYNEHGVVIHREGAAVDFVALRIADGATRWSAPARGCRMWAGGGDLIVCVNEPDGLHALDASSGITRWRARTEATISAVQPFQRSVLALLSDGTTAVLDRRSGSLLRRVAGEAREVLGHVHDDETMYVLYRRLSGHPRAHTCATLSAIDALSGAERWARDVPCFIDPHNNEPYVVYGADFPDTYQVAVGGDVVAVCGGAMGIRLHDRRDGGPRGEVGAIDCRDVAVLGRGGQYVLAIRGSIAVAVRRSAFTAPTRRVTVYGTVRDEGRPLPDHEVQVADRILRTDHSGGYRVSIDTRGDFLVTMRTPPGREARRVVVAVRDAPEYRVDLQSFLPAVDNR